MADVLDPPTVASHGAAGSTRTAEATTPAAAGTGAPTDERALERGIRTAKPASLAAQLASARLATARYATSLGAAKADGYRIITRDIPNMGWHFMNPKIQDFDVRRPPILVYEKTSPTTWQLAALEWVFPKKPAKSPFPSARYGSFPAACHYDDGTFVPQASQDRCAKTAPDTGAAFTFWHPDLVTLHVWLWYPNPDGFFASYNPLVKPFNGG